MLLSHEATADAEEANAGASKIFPNVETTTTGRSFELSQLCSRLSASSGLRLFGSPMLAIDHLSLSHFTYSNRN